MKFTEEEFSEKLKKSLTSDGKKPMQMSERTFKKFVGKIYKRIEKYDEESELDASVEEYLEELEELEGNYNKDRADFVKDWKEKHPDKKEPEKKEPEKKEPEKKDPNTDKDTDERITSLLKKVEEMQAEMKEAKTKAAISKKRDELKSTLKKAGIDDSEWIKGYLGKLNITEDTDVDSEKDDALKLYNRQNVSPSHETPGYTGGGNGKPDLSYLGIE